MMNEEYTPDMTSEEMPVKAQQEVPISEPSAPAPQPPAPPEERGSAPRRVGVVTLGLCLIATGALLLCALFLPNFDYGTLAKFSPVVLIFLGIEVLVGYFRSKGRHIKYDFFSGFICLVLAAGCICLSFLPSYLQYYGPERNYAEAQIREDVYDSCYEALRDVPGITEMSVNVYLMGRVYPEISTKQDLLESDYVSIHVSMDGDYDTKEAFAAAAQPILQKLAEQEKYFTDLTVTYRGEKIGLRLEARDRFSLNLSAEQLAKRVEILYSQDEKDLDSNYTYEY